MRSLGVLVENRGERMLWIDPEGLASPEIDPSKGEFSRSSVAFLPILLARFGRARVPLPGGDKIGKRPLERHFLGLEQLGVCLEVIDGQVEASLPAGHFVGGHYRFAKNSHTGTETLLMAAALAHGTTILENAAVEPEVIDLINFLNGCGAQIRMIRPRTYQIHGVRELYGTIYKIMPDRNETISYACAALATRGDVIVENARSADLTAFLAKLSDIGGGYEIGNFGVRFYYYAPLRATDIVTGIHPGFMTDWQPLMATLLTQCAGVSTIHETVMQSRFQYVEPLAALGADIEVFQPEVADREATYNFNLSDDKPGACHAVRIQGPAQLGGKLSVAVHDLRAGATLMLAGLAGSGELTLTNIEQIDRGYERLDEKLAALGGQIKRVQE